MDVLLSIKPRFVFEIINGRKKYEFRKNIFKQNIEIIYIYSSNPTKKIIGYFTSDKILYDDKGKIWNLTHDVSGLSKEEYDNYFINKKKAYALSISNLTLLENYIDPYQKIKNFCPPQSFRYIERSVLE